MITNNFRHVESTVRLCRHTHHPDGKKVSRMCWPGMDCGEDMGVENDTSGEATFSYLLFLDTCVEEATGRRQCSTQFVRNCPHLEQEKERETNEMENLDESFDQIDMKSSLIKTPRVVKETKGNKEDVVRPMKRLTLGLKRNRWEENKNTKTIENTIVDENLKINPNIVVNYLNKKKNRRVDAEEDEHPKLELTKDLPKEESFNSIALIESSTEYAITEYVTTEYGRLNTEH